MAVGESLAEPESICTVTAPAGDFGLKMAAVPERSTATHSDADGHASPLIGFGSIEAELCVVGWFGSKVTSAPDCWMAVHCEVDGHAISFPPEIENGAARDWVIGSKVISFPFWSSAAHSDGDAQASAVLAVPDPSVISLGGADEFGANVMASSRTPELPVTSRSVVHCVAPGQASQRALPVRVRPVPRLDVAGS